MTTTIDKQAQTMIEGITALDWHAAITTDREQKAAAKFLSGVKAEAKSLKAKKEAITKPLNAALKEIRAQFKPAEDRIADIEGSIKSAMLRYHEIRDAEAQGYIDRIERDGRTKIETKMAKLAGVDQPQTDLGGAQIKYGPTKVRITNALLLIQDHPSILTSERVLEALRLELSTELKDGGRVPHGAELYRERLVAGIAA
jgi:hypothetical protein